MAEPIGRARENWEHTHMKGIGGLLWLPVIHLVLIILAMLSAFGASLTMQGSTTERFIYIAINGLFLAYYLYCGWRFAQQKRQAKWLMISLYGLTIVYDLVTLYSLSFLPREQVGAQDFGAIIGMLLPALFIAYFLRSERVRLTFVN